MGPIHRLTLQNIIDQSGAQQFRDEFILENTAQNAAFPLTMFISERSGRNEDPDTGDVKEGAGICSPAVTLSRYTLEFICADKKVFLTLVQSMLPVVVLTVGDRRSTASCVMVDVWPQ